MTQNGSFQIYLCGFLDQNDHFGALGTESGVKSSKMPFKGHFGDRLEVPDSVGDLRSHGLKFPVRLGF